MVCLYYTKDNEFWIYSVFLGRDPLEDDILERFQIDVPL